MGSLGMLLSVLLSAPKFLSSVLLSAPNFVVMHRGNNY
jgi:hypothetical protein